ncbi:FAD-binding oxidoreductase [Pseudoxanthobacter sp.]|uniref:NAD(P)/FAD-dependent oxidoreductase n=1 Tax=Pseudoxanthobacter sp. TaxID=1925742 RepID=UPI002FE104F9
MTRKPAEADVVIVGGGIMGTASALFLARRGRSVILLERGMIGRQASGTNFGAVRRQGRPFSQMPLANRSRELWWQLPELISDDCEFVRRGHLRIALDQTAADKLVTYATEARHVGLDAEILSGNALRSRFPWLSQKVVAGSFSPLDGHANPRLTGPAFGRAAARAGARIVENATVVHAGRTGPDFEVETAEGHRVRAPVLLLTAGAWSAAFAGLFADPAPLEVRGPQLSVTEPLPYFIGPNTSAAATNPDESVYFRQVERGNLIIGGPRHGPASIRTGLANVLPENLLLQLAQARSVVPVLARARIIRSWSGVEGYTPDAQPVIGASPRVAGLYYAFGFSGAGFQLGPAVGEVMAALIDGGASPISLEAFAPGRFPEGLSAEGAALRSIRAKGG